MIILSKRVNRCMRVVIIRPLIGQAESHPPVSLKDKVTIIITPTIIDQSILTRNSQLILVTHVLDAMVLV